jgi:phospholipid/cholesterol/gamma-HCH transport system substrate-binding protein
LDALLKNNDMITDTESAVDIEELVSKYIFGGV